MSIEFPNVQSSPDDESRSHEEPVARAVEPGLLNEGYQQYGAERVKTDQLVVDTFKDIVSNDPNWLMSMMRSNSLPPIVLTRFAEKLQTETGKVYFVVIINDEALDKSSFYLSLNEPEMRYGQIDGSGLAATSVADIQDIKQALNLLSENMELMEEKELPKTSELDLQAKRVYVFQHKTQRES